MATQPFVPLGPPAREASVGAVPDIAQDATFQRISKFASRLNISQIQTAREEQYIEGQMDAAQNQGVSEVRQNSPWVSKLFGGGAALSGAMDYMEKSKILAYKQAVVDDMDNLRQLRTEDFKQQQLGDIQQFMTDDDATNARIMRSFGTVLPSVVKAQTKAHEAWVQEKHLESMTEFMQGALQNSEQARAQGDVDDVIEAESLLIENLDRPPGMNQDAYKTFLYESLAHASSTGDTVVAKKIQDLGLVDSPADIDALDKAEAAVAKYRKGQEVFEFGSSLSSMKEMASNVLVPETTFLATLEREADQFGYSPEQTASFINQRRTALEEKSKLVDYEHNIQLVRKGSTNRIPQEQRQDSFAIMDEAVREGRIPLVEYINGLDSIDAKSKATSERWSASISSPIEVNADGVKEVTQAAAEVLDEMDSWYATNEAATLNQMNDDTAALYMAYRARRGVMPGASPVTLLQSATEDVAAAKDAPRVNMSKVQKEDAIAAFLDVTNFDEDHFENRAFAADFSAIQGKFGGSEGYGAQGLRAKYMMNRYEVVDGDVYPKVDGKSLEQWVGIDKPIERMHGLIRRGLVPGSAGHDIVIQPKQREGYFSVWSVDEGAVLGVVPFTEVVRQGKAVNESAVTSNITAIHEQNYTEELQTARNRVLNSIKMDVLDLPSGYGIGQRFDKTRPTDHAERKVAEMSDEEIFNAYEQIKSEPSKVKSMLKGLGEKLHNSAWFGVGANTPNPIGVEIGKWLGFNAEEEAKKKMRADQAKAEKGFNMVSFGLREHTEALQMSAGLTGDNVDGRVGPMTIDAIAKDRGISHEKAFEVASRALNADRVLHAVGMYQVIGNTLNDTYEQAGLTLDTVFDEDAQDQLFEKGLVYHQPAVRQYMDRGFEVQRAAEALAEEWIGLNKAPISERISALEDLRGGDSTALKGLIQRFEADARGYESYNRGGVGGGYGIFVDDLPENLTGKTIRQILVQQSVL